MSAREIPVIAGLTRYPEIFICHSSLDKNLLEEIKTIVKKEHCRAFIADQEISGLNPCENIMLALWRSDAVFAILTKNALKIQSTRDWIFFELGFAKGVWRSREKSLLHFSIFAWKHPEIILPKGSPIKFITSYQPIKRSRKSRNKMLEEMSKIANRLFIIARPRTPSLS